MIIQQAFKFRLRPQPRHLRQFAKVAGCCRYVYNRMLAMQKENYAAGGKYVSSYSMMKMVTQWKREPATSWLAESPVSTLEQAVMDLDAAFKAFFAKRTGFPRFKKKSAPKGFHERHARMFTWDDANGRVRFPKIGWIRYRKSRSIIGKPVRLAITCGGGDWFVVVQVERDSLDKVVPPSHAIGVDLGVSKLATLSDGTVVNPVNAFGTKRSRMAMLQRRLSRKTRFSANWQKAKKRVARLYSSIANIRNDYLHKLTTTISKNHTVVCIEDLQVSRMSASATGTAENPGRNVRQKAGLNRSILDQGWREMRRQLEYKTQWRGGKLIVVPPHHTSQRCSKCGHVSRENRKTQASFACVSCGHTANADVNAAINIREAGLALLACGGSAMAGSAKQEPIEAIRANRGADVAEIASNREEVNANEQEK